MTFNTSQVLFIAQKFEVTISLESLQCLPTAIFIKYH